MERQENRQAKRLPKKIGWFEDVLRLEDVLVWFENVLRPKNLFRIRMTYKGRGF